MKFLVSLSAAIALCMSVSASAVAAERKADPLGDLIASTTETIEKIATDLTLKATFYHAGAKGVGSRDSLGCTVAPMRTLAVDPRIIPKRSIVFIQETVGMILPDGGRHDGLWYASDTGGAIKGTKVDFYTGSGAASMRQFFERKLNTVVLNAVRVGAFTGCPPR